MSDIRHFVFSADHISAMRGTTYSRAGDVVLFVCQTEGVDGIVITYQDAKGERFSCAASLIREVSNTIPLKKQPKPFKK